MHSNGNTRLPAVDEREVLRDERFRRALGELADQQGREYAEVERYARKCLGELSVRPGDRYLGWTAALARFMYTRSFDREFDVNADALEALNEQAKTRPVVFLWSHKSHLDAFVFMRTLYDADFRPQPLTFAGINMNFLGFGALIRHSGAIFLRREFKDDEVYKLALKFFIDYLAAKRVALTWSIEGTRSRTGKLLRPKMGLVRWFMDAYRRAAIDDALFVPVAISFDQIPEMDDYIAMQHGQPKRRESLRWFIEYISGMKSKFGKVYVRFAEPISLSELGHDAAGAEDDGETQVQKLCFEICTRIEHAMPVTLTDIVTLVLLAANGRALDGAQISEQAGEVFDLIEKRALPTVGELDARNPGELQAKLQSLTRTGLLDCYAKGATPVYRIRPGKQLAAAYYRNTIIHYFLSGAMAEVALAASRFDPTGRTCRAAVLKLRDLFKFEFSFRHKAAFAEDAVEFLNFRYPHWRRTLTSFRAGPRPLFGQGILRSFVEAYWILGQLLLSNGGESIPTDDEPALIEACLARGKEMLLRGEISTEAALSKPLFETALRLVRHRRLLAGTGARVHKRRVAFAQEVQEALAAINRLQEIYDRQLREPAPKIDARSIA
ncbi:MAG TPA: 1-acyl-sn-glycerol-3-phosphate acyltransferase [Woeseiaceae bacterium]|nr:1-acyl-sn-glycerol-3-phosphate acyltransferase [Woeseiaceae bacterium]